MKSILSIFLAVTLSLVISIVIFPAYPVMAQGTIYVPGDYDTIQEAITEANSGDTIYVSPGTYTGYLFINKPLTLEGADRKTTIIEVQSQSPAINVKDTSGVTINNLTVKNDGWIGINVYNSSEISLVGNNIYSKYREGVYILSSSGINLVDNNIYGESMPGVKIESSSEVSLVGNNIHDSGSGIVFVGTSNSTISNNTIFNNASQGIYLSSSDNNTVTGNTIYDNKYGIWLISSSNINKVYNNNFIDNWGAHAEVQGSSGNEFNLDKPIGGNYWSGFTAPDDNNDGFFDWPYEFYSGVDDLPWVLQDGWKEIPTTVDATVDIKPDTLNLNSKGQGKWITCYIELGENYNVDDIDVSTIELNGTVPPEEKPADIGDYDEDNIPDLMVKFDRTSVQGILEVGDEVEIVITGELTDGTSFEGTDTIRVIDKGND